MPAHFCFAHIITYIIGVALALSGCNSPDAPDFLQSAGKDKIELRQLPGPIRRIVLDNDLNLILTPGTSDTLRLTGGGNLLPDIATDWADSTLTIRDRNRFRWVRRYRRIVVEVPAARLASLTHKGIGRLTCADTLRPIQFDFQQYGTSESNLLLHTDRLSVDLNGSGSLKLAGQADYAYLGTLKLARLDAAGLRCRASDADCRGAEPLYCWITDTLAAHIRNRGNIEVAGRPKYSVEKTGSGGVLFR